MLFYDETYSIFFLFCVCFFLLFSSVFRSTLISILNTGSI